MKNIKVAVQSGLKDVESLLVEKGFEVVPYRTSGLDVDVTVITGVDSAYEEIEPAQCRLSKNEDHDMLVINATNLTPEQVLNYIEKNPC